MPDPKQPEEIAMMRWRVGRKLGRTLYRQDGAEPSSADTFLGLMETEELAEAVVEAMRRFREDPKQPEVPEEAVEAASRARRLEGGTMRSALEAAAPTIASKAVEEAEAEVERVRRHEQETAEAAVKRIEEVEERLKEAEIGYGAALDKAVEGERERRETVTLSSGEPVSVPRVAAPAVSERDFFAVLAGWDYEGDGEHSIPWDFERVKRACLELQDEIAVSSTSEEALVEAEEEIERLHADRSTLLAELAQANARADKAEQALPAELEAMATLGDAAREVVDGPCRRVVGAGPVSHLRKLLDDFSEPGEGHARGKDAEARTPGRGQDAGSERTSGQSSSTSSGESTSGTGAIGAGDSNPPRATGAGSSPHLHPESQCPAAEELEAMAEEFDGEAGEHAATIANPEMELVRDWHEGAEQITRRVASRLRERAAELKGESDV
jgi:hypothetical protein